VEHVANIGEMKNSYKILVAKPERQRETDGMDGKNNEIYLGRIGCKN
jgi:hypothetical protein